MENIAAAAISKDGLIISVPRPGRHHTIFHAMDAASIKPPHDWEQGFVTTKGRFVDRQEGFIIAKSAGQIIKKHGPDDTLFSEDMW